MKPFLVRLALFALPVVAVYAFAFTFFYYGRELTPVSEVIKVQRQATTTTLYHLAYDDNNVSYKIAMTIARDPSVIVIGPSHATQFRSEFFAHPADFYNASGVGNLADAIRLVSALPEKAALKLILLDVEPSYLTVDATPTTGRQDVSRFELLLNFFKYGWRNSYRDYAKGKFTLAELMARSRESSAIGIAALMQETGQRSDGSYKPLIAQGDGRRVAVEDQTADALEEIASNRYGRGGPRILDARVKELERFLSLCHERGIRVIGFIPPVAQEEHDALISTNNEYTETVRTLYARFDATLADFTFPLYDTSSLRALGSSNSELLDGRHGSEKATLRVLLYLAKKDPAFASLIRPDAAALIRKSTSDIEVL